MKISHSQWVPFIGSLISSTFVFEFCAHLVHFVTIFSSCFSIFGTDRALCFVILLWALPLSWGFHKGHWHKPSCNMVYFCNNLLLYWNATNCNIRRASKILMQFSNCNIVTNCNCIEMQLIVSYGRGLFSNILYKPKVLVDCKQVQFIMGPACKPTWNSL